MSARGNILNRLRKGQQPFTDVQSIAKHNVIVPMDNVNLLERFIEQARALSAHIHQADSYTSAIKYIQGVLSDDKQVLSWDFDYIPLVGLQDVLRDNGVAIADSQDGSVRIGITGAEAALSATGSLVISAKEGRPRSVSLLPHVHIAIITQDQILPHFDAWIELQSQNISNFRDVGNHTVITGASRTADIGMELVLGAHGPAELHIILLRR